MQHVSEVDVRICPKVEEELQERKAHDEANCRELLEPPSEDTHYSIYPLACKHTAQTRKGPPRKRASRRNP